MKVGMFIGKVKKFGIGWCIPHRMAADNAKGGPTWYRVKLKFNFKIVPKITSNFFKLYTKVITTYI